MTLIKEVLATTLLVAAFATPVALVSTMSCKIDDGGDEEGDGDSGDPTCNCPSGQQFGDCVCQISGDNIRKCQSDADCQDWCGLYPGTLYPMECYNQPDEGSCTSWNPTAAVRLVAGVRRVDDVWLANLIAQPAPLWTCDNAIFDDISTGKFKVLLANSGELIYQLGMRNNDIPQTLNGMPLISVYDAFDAFEALYLGGTTSYSLVVKRGTSNITLSYLID